MRNLLAVCAALVVMLGMVSAKQWQELRAARQQVVDLQGQLAEAKNALVRTVPDPPRPVVLPPPPAPSGPPAVPTADVVPRNVEPLPPPPPPPPVNPLAGLDPAAVVAASARQRPIGLPTLSTPLYGNTEEERRSDAFAQSDRTATSRVAAWNTALNLTPEQLAVLNTTAIEELRRETDESLQIVNGIGALDARSAARLKVETVTRQHATLMRIVDRMGPHLSPEKSTRMRVMFDGWLQTNMAQALAEEEDVLSGH